MTTDKGVRLLLSILRPRHVEFERIFSTVARQIPANWLDNDKRNKKPNSYCSDIMVTYQETEKVVNL